MSKCSALYLCEGLYEHYICVREYMSTTFVWGNIKTTKKYVPAIEIDSETTVPKNLSLERPYIPLQRASFAGMCLLQKRKESLENIKTYVPSKETVKQLSERAFNRSSYIPSQRASFEGMCLLNGYICVPSQRASFEGICLLKAYICLLKTWMSLYVYVFWRDVYLRSLTKSLFWRDVSFEATYISFSMDLSLSEDVSFEGMYIHSLTNSLFWRNVSFEGVCMSLGIYFLEKK